ncbi:MAG: FUSC family protein [Pseudomonadota bacterium]
MTASLASIFQIDRAGAQQALRMALAALLAFSIAAMLHVHNAYWAAMPVWVVAQSARGLLLERGFYRIVGTVLGAAAGFGMLHVAAGHPYALLALLGVWVALNAAFTHIFRGVLSYGAMMAGMTAAVVVLPSVTAPEHMLALAAARVECTLIGVVVVTLVTGFFTPHSRRDEFYRRVQSLAADAQDFAAQAASGASAAQTAELERRTLAGMSDVDANARLVAAGSVDGYRRLRHCNALISASIAVMAAGSALRARRARGAADADAVQRLAEADAQRVAACEALMAEPGSADARSFGPKVTQLAPHRDWQRACTHGLVSGGATFIAAAAGYASGWPAGELAALGVCIFSMVLGSLAAPKMVAPKLLAGVLAGVLFATFYRFVIQPHVDGTGALVLSVAPFIVLGAFARFSRRTAMPALDANMCFMLGSQAGMPAAGAAQILNGAAALLLAAALVGFGFWLAPDRSAERSRGFAQAIRRDLQRLLYDTRPTADWHARSSRRILRLMLDLQRAGRHGEAPAGLLAAANLGHAVVALQGMAASSPSGTDQRAYIERTLQAIRGFEADPLAVAEVLERLAADAAEPPLMRLQHDAADALRAGATLA